MYLSPCLRCSAIFGAADFRGSYRRLAEFRRLLKKYLPAFRRSRQIWLQLYVRRPPKKTHFRKCVQSAQRIFPRDASVYEISRWHQYMCSLAAVPLRGLALRDCKIPEDKTHICQHIWALNIHIHSTLIGTRKLLSSSDWKQSEITITQWNTTRLKWDMFTFTYEHGSVNLSRSWKV